MITFGLTGNIAMGKSTVTKTFRAAGIPMVDADIVSRQVVELGTPGLAKMVEAFGPEYLQADGTLDRAKLGTMIFAPGNAEQLKLCNDIMQPLIKEESFRQIEEFHKNGFEIVGYDAALICENGNADGFRPLIMVRCTPEQQLERLMKRGTGHGPLTMAQATAIINVQMPIEKKIAMADWIIDTSGTIEDSIKQTETTILCLKVNLRDQKMREKDNENRRPEETN
jgi:dephospho-CoA kinase